jgi:hypothetical protein
MEQTSQQLLQNKASEMIVCLEFIKLNLKSNSKEGRFAQGKRKLEMWKHYLWRTTFISVNISIWIFIIYNLFV